MIILKIITNMFTQLRENAESLFHLSTFLFFSENELNFSSRIFRNNLFTSVLSVKTKKRFCKYLLDDTHNVFFFY